MIKEKTIEVKNEKDGVKILFKKQDNPIIFKTLSLKNHISPDNSSEWIEILVNSEIEFICEFKNGMKIENTISPISFLSPDHKLPIFDLNFVFPKISFLKIIEKNMEGEITIKLILNEKIKKGEDKLDVTFELVYQIDEETN